MTFNFIYKYARHLKPDDKYEVYEDDRLKEIIIRKLIERTESHSVFEVTTEGGTAQVVLPNSKKIKVIKPIEIPSIIPEGKVRENKRSQTVRGRSLD